MTANDSLWLAKGFPCPHPLEAAPRSDDTATDWSRSVMDRWRTSSSCAGSSEAPIPSSSSSLSRQQTSSSSFPSIWTGTKEACLSSTAKGLLGTQGHSNAPGRRKPGDIFMRASTNYDDDDDGGQERILIIGSGTTVSSFICKLARWLRLR